MAALELQSQHQNGSSAALVFSVPKGMAARWVEPTRWLLYSSRTALPLVSGLIDALGRLCRDVVRTWWSPRCPRQALPARNSTPTVATMLPLDQLPHSDLEVVLERRAQDSQIQSAELIISSTGGMELLRQPVEGVHKSWTPAAALASTATAVCLHEVPRRCSPSLL